MLVSLVVHVWYRQRAVLFVCGEGGFIQLSPTLRYMYMCTCIYFSELLGLGDSGMIPVTVNVLEMQCIG